MEKHLFFPQNPSFFVSCLLIVTKANFNIFYIAEGERQLLVLFLISTFLFLIFNSDISCFSRIAINTKVPREKSLLDQTEFCGYEAILERLHTTRLTYANSMVELYLKPVLAGGSGFSRMRDLHGLNKVLNIDEKVYCWLPIEKFYMSDKSFCDTSFCL